MNVKFLKDQSYMISVGGDDKTIMQWKLTGLYDEVDNVADTLSQSYNL